MSDFEFEFGEIKKIGIIVAATDAITLSNASVDIHKCPKSIVVINDAPCTITVNNPKQSTISYTLNSSLLTPGEYLCKFKFDRDAVETRIICRTLTIVETEC